MFERFTDPARRVLTLAQEEARLLNHNFIGTEHILLGLLHQPESVAGRALAALDINLYNARAGVEETIGPAGLATTGTGSPPFTPRAKKVLELALREALELGHNCISPEHLLLGLVREGEGVGAQVLVKLGADLSRLRQQVTELLAEDPGTTSGHVQKHVQKAVAVPRPPGPLCSWCRSELSESARYRTIDVPPDESGGEATPLKATVFYCSRCGTVLAPT